MNSGGTGDPAEQPEPTETTPTECVCCYVGANESGREARDAAPSIAAACSCCGMEGPGGKLRVGLLLFAAVVMVALLVWGFATAS